MLTAVNIGPYTGISLQSKLTFGKVRPRTFIVAVYGAFNAMGLIGSEKNGIVILDEDEKRVLLDEHAKADSGYFGATVDQMTEFTRITAMTADDFQAFVNAHRRKRYAIDLTDAPLPTKRAKKFNMRAYVKLAQESVSYKEEEKAIFLSQSRTVAMMIAGALGLNEGQYDVHVNKAGIACSGEVYLHSDTLYICFEQSCVDGGKFMYRSCKGRKDYTGGANRWMHWADLLDFPKAVATFKQTAGL